MLRSPEALLSGLFVLLLACPVLGTSLLVRAGTDPNVGGYGKGGNSETTSVVSQAFDSVGVSADFSDLSQLQGFDALWVNTDDRDLALSATEVSNLQSFAASGKPIVLFGENEGWDTWNQSITSIPGAAADPDATFGGTLTTTAVHALVTDVFEVGVSAAGEVVGSGTSLFDVPVAMVFGPNVLVILDSGLFQNGGGGGFGSGVDTADNRAFRDNLVTWLGGDLSQVPEPTTGLLLGLGLAGVAASRRGTRAARLTRRR